MDGGRVSLPYPVRPYLLLAVLMRSSPLSHAKFWLNRSKSLMLLSGAGALTAPLSQTLSDGSGTLVWLIDLAAHWQWLYLLVGALAAAVLLGYRQWIFALLGCSAIAVGWFSASPAADSAGAGSHATLTVVSANIHADNDDLDALHRWVQQLQADIVVIQEVSPPAAAKLETWLDYPHRQISPEYGPFGMAVLLRQGGHGNEAEDSQIELSESNGPESGGDCQSAQPDSSGLAGVLRQVQPLGDVPGAQAFQHYAGSLGDEEVQTAQGPQDTCLSSY